jgi:hypothetical protein
MEMEWKFRCGQSAGVRSHLLRILDAYVKLLLLAQTSHVHGVLTLSSFGQATAVCTDPHLEGSLLGHVAWESLEMAA